MAMREINTILYNIIYIIYIYISIFDGHGFENSIYCVLMDIIWFHGITIGRTWI